MMKTLKKYLNPISKSLLVKLSNWLILPHPKRENLFSVLSTLSSVKIHSLHSFGKKMISVHQIFTIFTMNMITKVKKSYMKKLSKILRQYKKPNDIFLTNSFEFSLLLIIYSIYFILSASFSLLICFLQITFKIFTILPFKGISLDNSK